MAVTGQVGGFCGINERFSCGAGPQIETRGGGENGKPRSLVFSISWAPFLFRCDSLSFSLSLFSSLPPSSFSFSLFIYIYVYLFFLFLFKFVFSSPLFVPLVSFKSQESSWLIFWCTLCLMYGVKSYVYRWRLMC